MGNTFLETQINNYIHSDPFTSNIFLPKLSEEISDKDDKSSNILEMNENIIDNESSKHDKKVGEKISYFMDEYLQNFDRNSIFKEPFESNKIDIDEYYFNFKRQKNMKDSYYPNLTYRVKNLKKNIITLFIFDWDNTLLPTYFLAKENILYEDEIPSEYLGIFSLLEDSIFKLLKFCNDKGDTYIITNSSVGWVEYSIYKYYPGLSKLLNDINIISAKYEYEHIYKENNKIWKEKAFLSLKEKINKNFASNIICFGDSYTELEAGKKLASEIENCFIKTIKFKEKPEPEDIINQINLILTKINYINSRLKNLSITIEQSVK